MLECVPGFMGDRRSGPNMILLQHLVGFICEHNLYLLLFGVPPRHAFLLAVIDGLDHVDFLSMVDKNHFTNLLIKKIKGIKSIKRLKPELNAKCDSLQFN